MLKIKEELLHHIWRHRLWQVGELKTLSGQTLQVVQTGDQNPNAGPDFSNARLRIGGLELAGNIEIHIRSSDWLKHGHQNDPAYNNIILHVVYEHDKVLEQNREYGVEVLELGPFVPAELLRNYENLVFSRQKLPCANQLKHLGDVKMISWMERMAVERLEHKTSRIQQLLKTYHGDYVAVLYTLLLRNFGFQVNAVPFELLSRQLPYPLLLKHSDNLFQLEALLLGTAGFLNEQAEHKYVQALQNEFVYLQHKYGLTVLSKEVFKFSRLRPANFPERRLAQVALLLHRYPTILNEAPYLLDYDGWMHKLQLKHEGFWKEHYRLHADAFTGDVGFGKTAAENLLINTIAPFFFFYGRKHEKPEVMKAAIELLSRCEVEKNHKTRLFQAKQDVFKNAADSQGLINLYDNYCSHKGCLSCGIGSALLKTA